VLALRARLKRSLLATALLSQGVPMLLMGDELSRTQRGNNNAYAQDNEISWLDWRAGARADPDLMPFTRNVIALRRRYDAFRRRLFFTGETVPDTDLRDVYWLAPEGREMRSEDWGDGGRQTLGVQLGNDAPDGERFLILLNAAPQAVPFKLEGAWCEGTWSPVLDSTSADGIPRAAAAATAGATLRLEPHSLVVLHQKNAG
jgi:glycogen operon protein